MHTALQILQTLQVFTVFTFLHHLLQLDDFLETSDAIQSTETTIHLFFALLPRCNYCDIMAQMTATQNEMQS